MSIRRIILPKTARDLLNSERQADLKRGFALLNALQNLRLTITSQGQTSRSTIQFSGSDAILSANVTLGQLDPETIVWRDRAIAAGGTFGPRSIAWADALIVAIKATGYSSKIIYLLPFLGSNLATARVPLRDKLGVGIAGNSGFVDSDFSESTGLQGNGTSKMLNSLVYPSDLGSGTINGGLGWWENNINLAGNVEPIGCYGNSLLNRYVLDLRSSARGFWWGNNTGVAGVGSGATNGHHYGQRQSAALRRLAFNGVFVGASVTPLSPTDANENTIGIVGSYEGGSATPWPGRGACAYMTDGSLSAADLASLNTILAQKLIGPTGR